MLIRPAWSNESGPWNENWRRLEPGYVVEQPLLASPWAWGRTVLTGSMAESEELATIYPRMASLEDQVSYLESSIESRFDAVAEQINSKVKEVLGDTMCIAGGMPISLLQAGTPEQVRAETKKIIETVGRDGGFIMSTSSVLDEADPVLVQAWADATREYGGY